MAHLFLRRMLSSQRCILRKLALLLSLSSFIFIGCDYTKYKNSSRESQKFNLPPEQKAQLSFNYVYQNVFATNCVSCHGNSGGVRLETYSDVLANLDKIKKTVFEDHSMPKRGSLTSEQLEILGAWIEMGTPAQPQSGAPEAPPEVIQPTFDSINKNIFQITCVKCHSPGNSAKRVLLTKEALLNSPLDLVLPGNADESGLVIDLERKDDKRMPPEKDGYAKLKDEQIKAIRDWINQGATN